MSLIQKNNPVGIDCTISRIQQLIWTNISWNKDPFSINDYESYQRAYKNEIESSRTKSTQMWEVFTGGSSGKEYREVLFDDNFLATSFFITSDNVTNVDGLEKFDLSIIFQIKTASLYPSITHRADEEAHREVIDIIKNSQWRRNYTQLTKGIRNVYREIGYGANEFEDMEPCHVFRIDLNDLDIC